MGQSQSTGSRASEPQGKSGQKTDYYELLGVTQTATDDEVKKAYRKKALELHPDRNYGNVEETTRLFAEIQSAYEVLADPQERAWYDSHSGAFLGTEGGSDGGPQSYTTADEVLKIFSKFSPRMDFSDVSTGFFGGLREQFTQLALEERLACQLDGLDMVEYPSFGGRDDSFETVVRPFYAAWAGFSTRKSFAWKDTYRYSEAPDRRVRRLMEKENRQLREEGIREFNDAVRSLVAFVKKRDPRYKANAQSEAQRQETLRQSAAAQAARSRAINQARMRDHVVPEWARSEEPEIDEEESEESEIENFECVACNKTFKSQNQFEAHERSKKHVKAVKQLCREIRAQDKYLDLEPIIHSSTAPTTTVPSESDDLVTANEQSEGFAIIETEGSPLMEPVTLSPSDSDNNDHEDPETISSITPGDDDDNDDDNYASRESVQTRLHLDVDSSKDDSMTPLAEQLSSSVIDDRPAAVFRMGKAKQKRAKKAAQNDEQATGILCANCHATFTSRTKLFTHIKENPSHAQPLKATKNKKR
ncbi:Heat shock protein DnaJ N-terminal [Penicillium odoratum]|uniref:Heat shock protein DnaJ N-terminal n=1 Tax=Penicillium odoratum TaxID=1167516 RepID=UPI0025474A57|nr:Heat shock protein DnaJ N-terminal [Penicillium odoratum]KAJ5772037.1 Heat shock protein DnaJ N-terminal [Penicillium odoratum]